MLRRPIHRWLKVGLIEKAVLRPPHDRILGRLFQKLFELRVINQRLLADLVYIWL